MLQTLNRFANQRAGAEAMSGRHFRAISAASLALLSLTISRMRHAWAAMSKATFDCRAPEWQLRAHHG